LPHASERSKIRSIGSKTRASIARRQDGLLQTNKKVLSLFGLICISACVSWISHGSELEYSFPVQPVDEIAFSKGGHHYRGIDIFGKRGTIFVAPVSGVIEAIQRNDEWNKKTNDPEKKGGRWVSLLGDDGIRYYGSHLESVSDQVCVGQRVKSGDVLGYLGNSGNARGTPNHLHFGISYASTPYSWKTRRGEIEPYHFLECILKKGCIPLAVLTKRKKEASGTETREH
jgi:peptidoglycan LD-endopeptidase LytH